MGFFRIVLVFVLFAALCHTIQKSLRLEKIKIDLLRRLGIPEERPAVARTRRQVPRYLLDLYNQQAYTKKKTAGRIIRAFFREPNDNRSRYNEHFFNFNTTTIKPSEKVERASMRIFKRPLKLVKPHGNFEVIVYRLAIPWKKDDPQWHDKLVYLDSKSVECSKEGEWIDLDVTSAVKYWTTHKSKNYGLWVSVRGHRVPSSDFNVATGGQEDPFLVAFGIDEKKLVKTSEVEEENDPRIEDDGAEEVKLRKESLVVQATRAGSMRSTSNLCKRYRLFVKFQDLNWNWILMPPAFSAFYCMGTCPEILEKYFNPTNHAIVQNLIHHRENNAVPAACCVPTKLVPISTLTYDVKSKTIVLKDMPNMVVKECGCR